MSLIETPKVEVRQEELVKLCAVDSELYAHIFFPRTFRQSSPPFSRQVWAALENPDVRLLNLLCFRGSAKTTRLRTFASKRIAYGLSRTILYIGASERDAIRSVQWLRGNVERNAVWRDTFNLRPGRKWEETQIEIEHGTFKHTVWILAAGITGSLRGINFDDYRPDLIIVDDPQTDETAATEDQRRKVADLILGAVKNSLAPETEEPNAKLVMSATPQHSADITQEALKDTQWTSLIFPCWTAETIDFPLDQQVSSWTERFPSATLQADKEAALRRHKLSIFNREMECRITSPETSTFMSSWLRVRDFEVPRGCVCVLGIDPVPPPSPQQIAKGMLGKDYEAQYVWGRYKGEYHLLDCERNRGHDPNWSISTAFSLARKWKVSRIIVETVAYQRVLKWLIEQEMKRRRTYYSIVPFTDQRSKTSRIMNTLSGLAEHGLLWIGPEHTEFAEQFENYPNVEHDDDLDASAIALSDLANPYLEDGRENLGDSEVEVLELQRSCP